MFSHFLFSALVALLFSSPVLAHMTLASPVPFGDPTTSPLNSDGSNYPCQIVGSAATFYTESSSSANNTMAIGATQTLSFHGSAVHGGGSCQLALTSDMQPSASTAWQVILSIEGGCPTTDGSGPSTYDYTIPDSIAPGKYVFAWTWISKLSGAPEYYMNCAPITVTGGSAKRDSQVEARDGNSTSSALPNLFVANLASINDCKTTTSTDPVYPDPGPNVLKPSTMQTNFQSPAGSNCFPLGGTSSSGSGSGSSSGSGSGSGSGSSSAGSGAASSAAPVAASSSKAASVAVPGTTLTTLTKSSSAAALTPTGVTNSTAAATGTATGTGGIFVTVSTGAAGSSATGAATPATTSAAPQASASGTSSSGGSGLSGSCTDEGMFNCVGGSQYQQCASGTWTSLQPMPAGTKCKDGESTTLWARSSGEDSSRKRVRRVRRL